MDDVTKRSNTLRDKARDIVFSSKGVVLNEGDSLQSFINDIAQALAEEREGAAKRIEASLAAKGPNIKPEAKSAFLEAANTVRAGWTTTEV